MSDSLLSINAPNPLIPEPPPARIMFLMGWASLSSLRYVRLHFHPYYRSIYFGTEMQMSGIQQSEILATCPGCMAILAVDPMQLSPKDKCPQCGTNLVSKETAEAYGFDFGEDE